MHASAGRRVAVSAAALLLLAATAFPEVGPRAQDAGTTEEQAYGDYLQGLHLFHGGDYEAAVPYFVRAKDEAAARAGYGSGEHATALNNLGELYRRMGRLDEAEAQLRQALAIEEQRLGPMDPNLAKPLNNLALVQRVQGRYDEAEANLKRSLRLLEDSLGRRHPDVAGSINNLARLYETTGQPERARPLLERALMIAVDTLGEAHPTTKRVAVNLERVKGQIAATGPTEAAAAAAENGDETVAAATDRPSAVADRGDDAASLVLPPPEAALPAPAAGEASEAVARAEAMPAASGGTAGAEEASRPVAAIPLPRQSPDDAVMPMEPAPGAGPQDATPGETATDAGSESDVAALKGAVLGEDEATTAAPVPQARPAGWRWPLLPPANYAMHLASVRSPVSATAEWERLAALLDLPQTIHQLEPERVEIPGEGVFYRVMGGPFATVEDAMAACGPIRETGDYCGILGHGD